MTWDKLRPDTRSVVERAVRGQIPNPIGIASEFANTRTYFQQNYGRHPISYEEWRRYTDQYAKSKKWTWIGEILHLDQEKQNAFFIDNRVKTVPPEAVRILFPG